MARIGILAVQGGFAAHQASLHKLGHETTLLRQPEDFDGLDGLILPGGESSTQLKLIHQLELIPHLRAFCESGHPVLATCAGLILLANEVQNPSQESLQLIDVIVKRNAWGRQLDSFEGNSDKDSFPLVFIRAPRILKVGDKVQILDTLEGEPIFIQQQNLFGATFHPELTPALHIHQQIFGTPTE